MSNFIPKANVPPSSGVKVGGLGRAAQKLQSAREKAANIATGAKPIPVATASSAKAKAFGGAKKTSFQRKAV